MCEVKLQIIDLYRAIFAAIQGHKSTPHCFPLVVDLSHYFVDQILVVRLLALG